MSLTGTQNDVSPHASFLEAFNSEVVINTKKNGNVVTASQNKPRTGTERRLNRFPPAVTPDIVVVDEFIQTSVS